MKQVTKIVFSIAGFVAIVATVFLYAFGFRLVQPVGEVTPDWEAVQALSSIVSSSATLYLTWYIAKKQEKLSDQQEKFRSEEEAKRFQVEHDFALKELKTKELELKVQLYDKRFKIYECYKKYPFSIIEAHALAGKNTVLTLPNGQSSNGAQALAMLILNGRFINGRHKAIADLQILEVKGKLTSAEETRRNSLLQQMQFENIDFVHSELAIIEQAEFCFDPDTAKKLICFFKTMFDYATIEIWHKEDKFDEIQKSLLDAIEDIKTYHLDDKLKEALMLSFNAMSNGSSSSPTIPLNSGTDQ